MHLLSKRKCNLLSASGNAAENTYEDAFITSYHIIHVIIFVSMISYSMLMHIGLSEWKTLLEFKEEPEEQQEAPQAIAPEGEEQTLEDLPKCQDHRPTSFIKGKSQSILSLPCFTKYHLSHLCLMH